ncbi:DUF4357 domain-containing protein [Metabacillus sp. HB246100]
MDIKLLKQALDKSNAHTVEAFIEEILQAYLNCNENIEQAFDNPDELAFTPSTYLMSWGEYQAIGISADRKSIVIKAGSDFNIESQKSLSLGYIKKREQLLSEGVILNSEFTEDYEFNSFSTAASCIRGSQLNGKKEFKIIEEANKMSKSWLDIIKEALENLGGQGSLGEIYKKVEELYPERCKGAYRDGIRGTIYRNSSDSDYFQGIEDAFTSVDGIGKGHWALR